jgi:hypothetical protein
MAGGWVQSQSTPCGIRGEHGGSGAGFVPSAFQERSVLISVRKMIYDNVRPQYHAILLLNLTESTGTSAIIWPTVPAPQDDSSQWNENWQGKPKSSGKPCPPQIQHVLNWARTRAVGD